MPVETATSVVILATLAMVVLTLILTPLVMTSYKRKVAASMLEAASTSNINPSINKPVDIPPHIQAVIPRIQPSTLLKLENNQRDLIDNSKAKIRRIAMAYALGGLAQAIVMAFTAIKLYKNASFDNLVPFLLVFALPTVATVSLVLSTKIWVRCLWMMLALIIAFAMSGDQAGLISIIFALYILLPTLIFLIFNLRYWRATSPIIMVLTLGGGLGWLCTLKIGQLLIGDSSLIWFFRLGGLCLGLWGALKLANQICQYYQSKNISDQMLFINMWWGWFTLIETTIFTIQFGYSAVVSLFAFVAFWKVSRMRLAGLQTEAPPSARLLLLRVFGHQSRIEDLLDELTQRWRPLGTVELIAAQDLAFKTITPSELYLFITGTLSRAFIKDSAHVTEKRLRRDLGQDPDGHYRVSQYFCHRDTWQTTLNALVDDNDAILMDLRGFDAQRLGCQYELNQLAQHLGDKTIVLLTDQSTNVELAEAIFVAGVPEIRKHLLHIDANVYILEANGETNRTVETAIKLLLGGRPPVI